MRGGFSIIYDPIGDCFAEPALRSIGWGGTYLVVGFAAGKIPLFPTNLMLLKGCAVSGVFIGRFQQEEPQQNAQNLKEIGELLGSGKLTLHIRNHTYVRVGWTQLNELLNAELLARWFLLTTSQNKAVLGKATLVSRTV